MVQTASILIIGNEILSGKTEDVNSAYLCRELRLLGVNVQKITVIPDSAEIIADEIARHTRQYTWVFSCGGVGPTHDDVTLLGISKGLSRPLVVHPVLKQKLVERFGFAINEAHKKLTLVPEGTELIFGENLKFPVFTVENIFIFPGVPEILQKKFSAIKNRFESVPFSINRIYIKEYEEQIAHFLQQVLDRFPDLLLGSYPIMNQRDYKVILTLESKDPLYLKASFDFSLNLIPKEYIFKTD